MTQIVSSIHFKAVLKVKRMTRVQSVRLLIGRRHTASDGAERSSRMTTDDRHTTLVFLCDNKEASNLYSYLGTTKKERKGPSKVDRKGSIKIYFKL